MWDAWRFEFYQPRRHMTFHIDWYPCLILLEWGDDGPGILEDVNGSYVCKPADLKLLMLPDIYGSRLICCCPPNWRLLPGGWHLWLHLKFCVGVEGVGSTGTYPYCIHFIATTTIFSRYITHSDGTLLLHVMRVPLRHCMKVLVVAVSCRASDLTDISVHDDTDIRKVNLSSGKMRWYGAKYTIDRHSLHADVIVVGRAYFMMGLAAEALMWLHLSRVPLGIKRWSILAPP